MKVKKEIIDVLSGVRVEGNLLFIDAQLDRKTYQDVNKVLKALGGKWSSVKKATVFNKNIEDILGEILLTGEYTDEKKEFQFFETPDNLVRQMIKLAKLKPEYICLEPSAGHGNIAKYLPNCDCIELNPSNRDSLIKSGFNLIHDDFMTFVSQREYDAIVMNPPFCHQQDIDHVTKAISIAKHTVVAVISSSPMWRTDKKSCDFRKLVASFDGVIEEIGNGAFKESGTNVNTALVVVHK